MSFGFGHVLRTTRLKIRQGLGIGSYWSGGVIGVLPPLPHYSSTSKALNLLVTPLGDRLKKNHLNQEFFRLLAIRQICHQNEIISSILFIKKALRQKIF